MKLKNILISGALAILVVSCDASGGKTAPPAGCEPNCSAPPPSPGGGITVSGKVVKWSGKPAGGINITVLDKDNVLQTTVSAAADGTFSVADVKTPYQLSAVPTLSTGIVPVSYDNVTIASPIVVVRKNTFTADADPGFATECSPAPEKGLIKIRLSQPVGVGNTGALYFLAPGTNYKTSKAKDSQSGFVEGDQNLDHYISFDTNACYNNMIGTVVYVEKDSGGTIVKKGVQTDVPVYPGSGSATKLNNDTDALFGPLSVVSSNSSTLSGTLTFPEGITSASVSAYIRVEYDVEGGRISKIAPTLALGKRQGYASLSSKTIQNTGSSVTWNLPIEDFGSGSRISYRVVAVGNAGNKTSTYWSDVISAGASGISLNLPSISGTGQPSGNLQLAADSSSRAPAGNIIPEFLTAKVENTGCTEGGNFLNNYVMGFNNSTSQWLGNSNDERIVLPDTNEPARISFETVYNNYSLNALCILGGNASNSSDILLDGRGIQRNFYSDSALTEPDYVRSGVTNLDSTEFQYK